MPNCYIIDAKRTPRGIGKEQGALHTISAISMLTQVLESIAPRELHPYIDDMLTGCVMPVGEQGANIARSALLKANFLQTICGMQINRFCSSGLDAINLCSAKIMSGQDQLCIASGVESMSRVPMLSDGGALMIDPAVAMSNNIVPQGISADLIASVEGFTRDELDAYALSSHQRAINAQKKKRLKSLIPVTHVSGITALATDEIPRKDTSLKKLAQLKPSFKLIGQMAGYDELALLKYPLLERISHLHHAGNSSALADGAAAILLASAKAVQQHQLTPRARIIAYDQVGTDPTMMLTAPSKSVQRLLKKARKKVSDIDLWEVNEAFSAVTLKFIKDLELSPEYVNVNGGAIAYGHPLGATGAILVSTLIDELELRKKTYGVCSLCTASGMAASILIERL
ncbi:acetyl-CoA C-acetyltransferase [Gammaproteobacteria bacterium]|nr:acetyl-CoA C-acetyltransferase [Gammaproteobacteria bacterium]